MYEYKAPGGEVYGPYEEGQLLEFVKGGRMDGNSLVRKHEEEEEWTPLNQVEELSYICREAAATVTPTPTAATHTQVVQAVTADGEMEKPGKLQAISILTLVGGILAVLWAITYTIFYLPIIGLSTLGLGCIFIVCPIYSLVFGIMAIVKGSQMLGDNPAPAFQSANSIAIMQVVTIICCDAFNLIMGIVNLVFLNDPEVKAWVRNQGGNI